MKPSLLVNPMVVYATVWVMTLCLFSLQMTIQIVPANSTGLWIVGGNIIFAVYLGMIFAKIKSKQKPTFDNVDFDILELYVRRLRLIWMIGTIIEISVSRGLPIIWAFTGQGFLKDYTDFGIPSFHGIMNAVYLQFMCGYFLLWVGAKRTAHRKMFFLFLLWPILMLGRGIFLSVIMQCLAIFLLLNKVGLKRMSHLVLLAIGNVFLFGFVGNLRGTSNPFGYLVENKWIWLFDSLPTGFLWVYIYITSGINNIFYNVQSLEPTGTFDKTFFKLIPSFVRQLLGVEERADALTFADANLNVSTFYAGTVSDFGAIGGLFYGMIVIFSAFMVYSYAKRYLIWAILAYSVLFQVLVFSIFYDTFLLLPTFMQIFIAFCFIFFHKERLKRRGKLRIQPTHNE